MGTLEEYCTPTKGALSYQHQSPILEATKVELKKSLDALGAAGATLNSTSLRAPFEAVIRREQPGLLEGGSFRMSVSWLNNFCVCSGPCG